MEVPKPAKEATPPHSDNVKLALLPEHDSGVSGTASFEEISEGVLVKLELRGLPKRSFQNCSEMLRSEPMAKELVTNELWEIVEPLLPKEPPKPEGGRPRIDDRAALTGIIFVLKSGIPWEMLPQEMGCGSGVTCWRRLWEWQEAGVWERVHQSLLDRLGEADQIDWERASLDSASVPAKRGERQAARIRRIRERRARSAILWLTERASRSV